MGKIPFLTVWHKALLYHGFNSREANNEPLAERVMEILPLYIYKEGVVGVGEIGFDDQTPAEEKYYRLQLELAKEAKASRADPHAAPRQEKRNRAQHGHCIGART
jgi:predicted metal-dependent TIM-barrel fold hydrolase